MTGPDRLRHRSPYVGSLLLWAAAASCGEPAPRTNVLLISLDTTRADALSCYGGPAGVSPVIDALAQGGVTYDRAVTPVPITLPAHASLLTGRFPDEHGVHNNDTHRLPASELALAEILAEEGYATGAFVGSYVLDARFGLAQGFGRYDAEVPGGGSALELTPAERDAGAVTDRLLAWLAEERSGPFFAFLHFYDPHFPHAPVPEFAGRFPTPYHGEIAYCDAQIGRVVQFLEERGIGDETLIVVTADHGEGRGEHGESTHGYFVYQSTIHVPLVVSHPALPGGARSSRLAPLTDVVPTILAFLGLPHDAERDLIANLARERSDGVYLASEIPHADFGAPPARGAIVGDFKLIVSPGPELYDLSRDAAELTNLIDREAGVARDIGAWIDDRERRARASSRFDAGEESRDRIAALGYGGAVDDEELVGRTRAELVEWVQLRDMGSSLLFGGKPAEAVPYLEQLLERSPGSYIGNLYLGAALAKTEQYERALRHLEIARKSESGRADLFWNIALCQHFLGRPRETVEALLRTLECDPECVPALQKLAEHYLKTGKPKKAREHLEAILEHAPSSAHAGWARRKLEAY